jgi:hypothetical protein
MIISKKNGMIIRVQGVKEPRIRVKKFLICHPSLEPLPAGRQA